MHVDHKTFTLLPSVEICGFHLIYDLNMVAGLESQARPKGFLSNFYHVIESYDEDDAVEEEEEFRFNDAPVHEGHSHQNGIFTLFGIETIKKVSHIIKSETAKYM